MREFRHSTGGRYDYSDDIHALQEFANSLCSFFAGCGENFVISGCEVDGNTYSEGYVWLAGKIRYVPSDTIIPQNNEFVYIGVDDVDGNIIDYGDASQYKMNVSYGAKYCHGSDPSVLSNAIPLSSGEFPLMKDVFFRHYTLVKNGDKQTIHDPLQIKDFAGNEKNDNWRLSVFNGSYEMRYISRMEIGFYRGGSLRYRLRGLSLYNSNDELVFTIGNNANGAISLPSMTELQSLQVSGNVDADTFKIGGTDIKNIFAWTSYPVDTGWVHMINSKTNAEIPSLYIRQIRERVIIKGAVPKEYVTSFNDSYVTIINKDGNTINDSSWVLYKLNIKAPSVITPPNASRLPGCVLSSNYQSVENLVCNNVELHVGADNYLYISGKPVNMDWRAHVVNGVTYTGPTINFNYLID